MPRKKVLGQYDASQAFVQRVRKLRQDRGWSAARLTGAIREAGYPIGEQTIRKQETMLPIISIDQAVVVARVFGVPLETLTSQLSCSTCLDAPPRGFTCNACGAEASAP